MMRTGALMGSTAAAPDLDWSQVRETVRMLNLAVAQIKATLMDGDESVSALTDSFTSMASAIATIQTAMAEQPSEVSGFVTGTCTALSSKIHAAIIAFQFYDKLSQKLAHVSDSLASLGDVVSDTSKLYNPEAWHALQKSIRAGYSVEDERVVFDAMMKGASLDEALRELIAARKSAAATTESDIDLF
jgi:hypothetical protein